MPSSTSMIVPQRVFPGLLKYLLLMPTLIPPPPLVSLVLKCVLPTERVSECSPALLLITLPALSSTFTQLREQCNKYLNTLLLTLLAWTRKCCPTMVPQLSVFLTLISSMDSTPMLSIYRIPHTLVLMDKLIAKLLMIFLLVLVNTVTWIA